MADDLQQVDSTLLPELRASVGMHVTVEIEEKANSRERYEFDLVRDKRSDFSAGLVSELAPLAQAILGHTSGEIVQYLAPSGTQQTVTILGIQPSAQGPEQPISDRDKVLGQVKAGIARRESRQIALTAELHYGSIDPDGIEEE